MAQKGTNWREDNKEVVIMYNGERDNECLLTRRGKCEGRSCVRRVGKNGWRPCLGVTRWLYAKLAKNGDVAVNPLVSIVQDSTERMKEHILRRIVSIREPNHLFQVCAVHLAQHCINGQRRGRIPYVVDRTVEAWRVVCKGELADACIRALQPQSMPQAITCVSAIRVRQEVWVVPW